MDLKNSAMMRIVVKWIQELEENYDITKRKEPFQNVNGEKIFLED